MNAIIIDDEKTGAKGLQVLLKKNCSDITVIAVEHSAEEGINSILRLKPDLVFLDIEMPGGTGFDVIEATREVNYEVVFTTAYEHYAIKAFKTQAVDYLLKPIDTDELVRAAGNVRLKIEKNTAIHLNGKLEMLLKTVGVQTKKIHIPTNKGVTLVDPAEIIYLESDSNYTSIFLKSGQKFLISKTLKSLEERLNPVDFCRVHSAYLVNLNEIEQYVRGDGGTLVMKNKTSIPVSRSHKQTLMDMLGF